MNYDELQILNWIEANSEPAKNVKTRPGLPAREMTPENINALLNAGADPFQLYARPSKAPARADYGTSAAIIDYPQQMALFAKGSPKNSLTPFSEKNLELPPGYLPEELKELLPQGVYEHEYGHFKDIRANPEKGSPYPYITNPKFKKDVNRLAKEMQNELGISGERAEQLARRELPAIIEEERFWNREKEGWSVDLTKKFEGYKEKAYTLEDIEGNKVKTIGYGTRRNSTGAREIPEEVWDGERPLSKKEAEAAFEVNYSEAMDRAKRFAGDAWNNLNHTQKTVVADMSYNLGNKLFTFEEMQKNLKSGRLDRVDEEMIDSKWYNQVGDRSPELVKLWNMSLRDIAPNQDLLLADVREPRINIPKPQNFKQAFASARRQGKKTFIFNGKKYTTKLA